MSDDPAAAVRCASAISAAPRWEEAADEAVEATQSQLAGDADLAFAFFRPEWTEASAEIAGRLAARLGNRLLGCTAEAVVGVEREVEEGPALSVWAARLPAAEVELLHLRYERTPDGGTFVGWSDRLLDNWPDDLVLLLLGEPFSFPTDVLLQRLQEDHPGTLVLGGMASGGSQPGANRLLIGTEAAEDGAVLAACRGVRVRPVVSQGCRPIGEPLVITQADRNVVQQLGGRPAMERLEELFRSLPTQDQLRVQRGLHLGRVVNEQQERFELGDFLIRNVVGADRESGAIAVGDYFRVGQTVQFHVRDHETATADLKQLLAQASDSRPAGGLLFSCNGRGTRLFPEPDHDAKAIAEAFPEMPLAGFFAQGEIGPIGGRNFLHGFTASLALFGSDNADSAADTDASRE